MTASRKKSRFEARLRRPTSPGGDSSWAFVVLPIEVSRTLPRRGRTTVKGVINGHAFRATLEPDGQRSHWLKIGGELQQAAGAQPGGVATIEIMPLEREPEPDVPTDLRDALAASIAARKTWDETTTIARVDWIHWITSAKKSSTRTKRIADACDMLSSGKKRVCCFDPSGVYSKALRAPEAAE